MKLPPILLTSSVYAMDFTVVLRDPEERKLHTLNSINHWLNIHPDIQLVICDGSGYDFTENISKLYPKRSVECLNFINDKRKIEAYGKGYGESNIINYALDHSTILKKEDWFCKCTGKLWVDNFIECVGRWNGHFLCQAYFSGVFEVHKSVQFFNVDTRFYISSKKVYQRYFRYIHLLENNNSPISLEDEFKRIIIENELYGSLFPIHPIVRGVAGGSGKSYKDTNFRIFKDRFRLKLVIAKKKYSKWFSESPTNE